MRPWRLGLTGGIGSGKSTVARIWANMGAQVIDADGVSKRLTTAGGGAIPALVQQFGDQCIDSVGALNRDWMRVHAFANPSAKEALERILHPLIGQAMTAQAQSSTAPCVVFDVPLLVESTRWRPQLDRVVVVDCEPSSQVLRVQQRSGWSADQIHRVIDQQASRSQRLQAADAVIYNDGLTLEALDHVCEKIGTRFGLSSRD